VTVDVRVCVGYPAFSFSIYQSGAPAYSFYLGWVWPDPLKASPKFKGIKDSQRPINFVEQFPVASRRFIFRAMCLVSQKSFLLWTYLS